MNVLNLVQILKFGMIFNFDKNVMKYDSGCLHLETNKNRSDVTAKG